MLAAGSGLLSPRHTAAAAVAALSPPPAPAFTDVVGPLSGELRLDPTGKTYTRRSFPLDLTDCTISASFRNPFAAARGNFSYGFRFRVAGDRAAGVYVTGNGFWVRTVFDDAGVPLDDVRLYGSLAGLRVGANDANDLRVVVTGEVGELFVNGTSVAAFLLDAVESGGVDLLADIVTSGANVANPVVRYEGFGVASPPPPPSMRAQAARAAYYGPADGGIAHDPDDTSIKVKGTGLAGVRDATVRARFLVPYSDPKVGWDCGFVVRRSATRQLRVIVASGKEFILTLGSRPDENADWDLKDVQRGPIPGLRTGPRDANDVEVTMSGAAGKLTINGAVVSDRLDLSGAADPGTVTIGTGFLTDDERRGATTRYENFAVIPLP